MIRGRNEKSWIILWTVLILISPALFGWTQVQQWRTSIRSTLFVPEPLPELAPRTHGRFEPCPGVVAERISYGTQFGMRIPAILYLPREHTGKIPSLIIVNGHGGDKYSWYAAYTGMLYARAGAAVLTYDPIGEGERNSRRQSGTRAHDRIEGSPELARRLSGLMITDLMQAVSYLSQRPETDSQRIGAAGYSMGSFVLSLAGAVDRRLRACVLVGGGNLDGPGEYWDHSKPMCQGIPYQSLQFLGDRPAVIYALHADRGPTLVPRAAHRPFFVTRPVALWLERQLDFPNWGEAEIRAMPETHISEWARQHAVELDPLYSGEDREGGTRALGTGFPGLTREQLTVFPAEEWEHQKEQLVLESWVAKTKLEE